MSSPEIAKPAMKEKLAKLLLMLVLALTCFGVASALAVGHAVSQTTEAHAATGWHRSHGAWWYENTDASYARGWQKINGAWYYFDNQGWMQTGWVKDGQTWYYCTDSGAMATGWLKRGSTWYYLKSSGAMQTGWLRRGGVWYYLTESGAMSTGWRKVSDTWYFFASSGAMQTGWLHRGGTWYYLNASGAMQTGWKRINGVWYYFKDSGAMQTGWQKINATWYYFYGSGAMAANQWIGNYYLLSSGAMAAGQWVDGGRYYVDETGKWDPRASNAPRNVPLFSQAGKLHVEGVCLADEQGNPVQLRGVSTHGLAWFPQYVNSEAFRTLRDDWGANVVRLAMYTAEYGGYCTGGDKAQLESLIDKGVKAATDLGMYVIIDWHILSDGSPTTYENQAVDFFSRMAKKYQSYDNVLYEICNEPQNSPFASVIKPYAQKVLKVIRAYDKDAIVLVGTNTWSQDVDDVIGNRIDDPNVMYTLHFYAGTHKEWNREKLERALNAGIPVFVTECSITDASGNGNLDETSGLEWIKLLNEYHISFVAWSLSNKDESSALIKPSVSKTGDWTTNDLSATGVWFRNAIKGR